jgi:hypothetical protein
LLIIDEIDSGDKEFQVLHRSLKEAGILDIKYMEQHNIRFIFISATMIRELYQLREWGEFHKLYKMTIPDSYIGHKEFVELGIIDEFYALNTDKEANRWIQEDILNHYENDYRVHIVRVTGKTVNYVQNACIRNGVTFMNHTSMERLTDYDTNKIFKESLNRHIVLGIKGFFRRANLIPNRWKLRIGATHEHFTNVVDNNVQIQGLPGRMTGYWRSDIEGGHKTGPHRTSRTAIEAYEYNYEDPFGPNPYSTYGFSKNKSGKVSIKKASMLSPKHILNLIAIPLPEVDMHNEYEITEPHDDKEVLRNIMKSRVKQGNVAVYKLNNDSTIQYRGNNIKIFEYESKEQFKKQDIFGGINKKEAVNGKIVCRIMPVRMEEGSIKWVGIYLKSAM